MFHMWGGCGSCGGCGGCGGCGTGLGCFHGLFGGHHGCGCGCGC
jgi:hypothetical protein